MSVLYVLEEASSSSGPWQAVAGSPFSATTDVVAGLNATTSFYFRITAEDTLLGLFAAPTIVGPVVTTASNIVESLQNTKLTASAATSVPPVGVIAGTPSGSSLAVSWAIPTAIYDSSLNAWSLYASGTSSGVQLVRNGYVLQATSNVGAAVYWDHTVWVEMAGSWYYFSGDALGGNWIPAAGDPATSPSPQQTDVAGGSASVPAVQTASLTSSTSTSLSVSWTAPVPLYDGVIIDQQVGSWQLSAATGQAIHNGVSDSSTANSVELLYWAQKVYRQTSSGGWTSWSGSAWVSATKDPRTDSSLGESPDSTFVPNTAWLIVDATGAVWTLSGLAGSYQINQNGTSVTGGQGTATVFITPGNGTFTDSSGNVYAIDTGINAYYTPAGGGAAVYIGVYGDIGYNANQMAYYNNTVYIQDARDLTWHTFNGSSFSGTVSAPPATSGSVSAGNVIELLYSGHTVYRAMLVTNISVTPGSGSVTDLAGNVWTVSSAGAAQENGAAVTGGGGAGTLTYSPATNTIYIQNSASGNWSVWNGSAFTGPVAAPGISGVAWSYWNNGTWTSAAGDPRVFGSASANNPVLFDDFTSLSLYNVNAPVAGTLWQPGGTYSPYDQGQDINGVWVVNPFNSATPFNNIYTVAGSILSVRIDNTPSGYSSAVGGDSFVGGRLHTFNTFQHAVQGYWEIRAAVPNLAGSDFSFWLNDQSSKQQINIFECVAFSGGSHYAAFSVWDPATITVANAWYTYQMSSPVDVTQMHTYGVEVTSTQVKLYIDKVLQVTFPLPAGYTNPMFIFMDYDSAGPAWTGNITQPGSLPVFAQVDHVGFWTARPF